MRVEPPVSVPIAISHMPSATATPPPEVEPPGARARHQHFADRAVYDFAERAWLKRFIDGWLARKYGPTVLGGLMDRFSRGLPSGACVLISLQPAGARLKLRLSSEAMPGSGDGDRDGEQGPGTTSVGPVLSWNPTTGSLQLSRQATQRLFHSLGGRLAERAGNDLTVFFPLAPG